MSEPVEDVDYFLINRVRYELYVEGTFFITEDEECDDFEVDAARIDLSAPMIVGTTVVGSEERRIDDPTRWPEEHLEELAGLSSQLARIRAQLRVLQKGTR